MLIVVLILSLLSPARYGEIANKIWDNECKKKVEGLTSWNKGEDFASLGIAHFIWYPEGKKGPFQEQFPDYLRFAASEGALLPSWLMPGQPCPWNTREEFQAALKSEKMKELREFLRKSLPLQAEFIANRLEKVLPKITAPFSEKDKKKIENNFHKVLKEENGVYVLADYLNFKGDGTNPHERYNGKGWGLLQVLLYMKTGECATAEFVKRAKYLLAERVKNAPKEKNEERWLKGWNKRLDTYLQ